ncbi:hypothetical protein CBS147332_1375 [Penicillium roqueforti]|nr:hypothetical protein CBS147332_1375 [Penicillium roqueforti]KAI3122936.1 hypothetical protein CBS147331_1386 [Penicillium roqueforti]
MTASILILVFCALFVPGSIIVASYILISPLQATTDTAPPTVVDKHCREQVILYLLENSPQIINTFGWLGIRFYLVWRHVKFCVDDLVKPLVMSLATTAYRAFNRFWFRNDGPQ